MKTAMRNQKMKENKGSLTVFFEEPFWVGVFELIEDGKLSVCKVTFGAEPKDYAVLEYVLQHYYELKFSPAVQVESRHVARDKIPAGPAAFAGAEQDTAQREEKGRAACRSRAPLFAETAEEKRKAQGALTVSCAMTPKEIRSVESGS